MEISLGLLLPRDAAGVPATRRLLNAALTALGVEEDIRVDIEAMLTEACTNVIKHAEHGALYTVRASIQDRRCRIKVIDCGTGFDAARTPSPERADDRGRRPLAGAVFKRETEVVRALLEAGADPRAGSPSAVDAARMFGHAEFLAWFEEAAPPPA